MKKNKFKRWLGRIHYKLESWYGNLRYAWPDNIVRIFRFMPAHWKDWDFNVDIGLYRLMRTKLAAYHHILSIHTGWEHEGDDEHREQIGKVLEALDRLINDFYETEFSPELERFHKGNEGLLKLMRNPEYSELSRKHYEREEELKQADIELVFNTIRDNHRSWWQ